MKPARYSVSRKSACHRCRKARAKCDRGAGCCGRCSRRGLPCVYPQTEETLQNFISNEDSIEERPLPSPLSSFSVSNSGPGLAADTDHDSSVRRTESLAVDRVVDPDESPYMTTPRHFHVRYERPITKCVSDCPEDLDFSDLQLSCPINVNDISNRWLNLYIPIPGQTTKEYPPNTTSFIYRMLKSYAAMVANDSGSLPFVHPLQMLTRSAGSPLATCLSLVKVCSNPLPGSESNVASVLQREMSSLFEQRDEYSDEISLAAFQAYLIYTMVLFFRLDTVACTNTFRQAMTDLQELACSSSRRGLVCAADQRRVRPRWEEWVIVETKRRTLFVMYLFDSILCTQEGLPVFLGTELKGLPAPSSKSLWQAQTRYDWEKAYNTYMADWTDGVFTIDELWPIPSDMDDNHISQRRSRVDHWLENIDEFGTMLYAIMNCTHGV